jgi:hypothetical protein
MTYVASKAMVGPFRWISLGATHMKHDDVRRPSGWG